MRFCWIIITICFTGMASSGLAQDTDPIYLTNPSFEDLPHHSKPPRGWIDCGFRGETPVDVQPSGTFSVTKPPIDGNTYMGMVVRDNDTWEAVSQRLSRPLEAGKCYSFSIYLSRSELYNSISRVTDDPANYVTPAKLRIYGGYDYCDKEYLLGETSLVINTRWLEYQFQFEPVGDYTHIIFEAFYKTPTLFPYNGNILMDNAGPINRVPCDEELIVQEEPEAPKEEISEIAVNDEAPEINNQAVEEAPKQPEEPPVAVEEVPQAPPRAPAIEPLNQPEPISEEVIEDVSFSNLSVSDLKRGTTLRTNQIFFKADASQVTDASFPILNEIFAFMQANPGIILEVGGHTNGLPDDDYCDQLSKARAKEVADYLIAKGINADRLEYKGYGKRQPIATNDTPAGRRKNQRVEFKVLRIDG